MARTKSTQSIDSRLLATIHGSGRGSVFVPADFLNIGSREAIGIALHRLARKGTIRRLARGVYDFPKQHPVLGPLSPSAETVASPNCAPCFWPSFARGRDSVRDGNSANVVDFGRR